MENKFDFSKLKKGDIVIVSRNGIKWLASIDKITPKGFVKVNGCYYYPDGTMRSKDIWNRSILLPCTKEEKKNFYKASFICKVVGIMRRVTTSRLDYEKAVKIYKILIDKEDGTNEKD